MPEGVEIEFYRRAAEVALNREVAAVEAADEWYLKGDTTPESVAHALLGRELVGARRLGKLLILDTSADPGEPEVTPRLGLRFGMTGRLLVDDEASIEYLEYSSKRNEPKWDRFTVHFVDGGSIRVRDPRRLGGIMLDPDEGRLGPDFLAIGLEQLQTRVLTGRVAVKTRLLDQRRIAGVGNLIVDETLWRARLDPAQPAGSVSNEDAVVLLAELREVVSDFLRDGGSHTGQLHGSRVRGGHCPLDGAELERRTIGGRTTYSCPLHQRISG